MSEEVSAAVRADWDNREFTDQLKLSIAQLFEFLARFGESSSVSSNQSLNTAPTFNLPMCPVYCVLISSAFQVVPSAASRP